MSDDTDHKIVDMLMFAQRQRQQHRIDQMGELLLDLLLSADTGAENEEHTSQYRQWVPAIESDRFTEQMKTFGRIREILARTST